MISRVLFATALIAGLLAIVWMAQTFYAVSLLGMVVIGAVLTVYLVGTIELLLFQHATGSIRHAIHRARDFSTLNKSENVAPTPSREMLEKWLQHIHPTLQSAVRDRVEGYRVGLPTPVLVPYLVGLLVMLGLLGTFFGMVDTLQGAVTALQGTTKLEAIREGLTAPIGGLSLAFGTSVAGIAASAMLGLMSTLSRRDRMHLGRLLTGTIRNYFPNYSHAYQQQATLSALQAQAQGLPAVTDQLSRLSQRLEQMSEQLTNQIAANQQTLNQATQEQFQALAKSVEQSLITSLTEGSKQIADTVTPLLAETMAQVNHRAHESNLKHQQQLADLTDQHLRTITHLFQSAVENSRLRWDEGVANHQKASERLIENWQNGFNQFNESFSEKAQLQLHAFNDAQQQQEEKILSRLDNLQDVVASRLTDIGQAFEAPLQRIIDSASEPALAARKLVEQLQIETGKWLQRDNDLLNDRAALAAELQQATQSLDAAAKAQLGTVESLATTSNDVLKRLEQQLQQQVETGVSRISDSAGLVAAGAVDMTSMAEAFHVAVSQYSDSNMQLQTTLEKIEQALERSSTKSDEQLAYYIAQARQLIDHSVDAQKEVIDELQQLQPQKSAKAKPSQTAEVN